MRVISGKYKGGKLTPPQDERVRPTTDRIKETIYNILCNKVEIEGSAVLDLFAGSGALGIEALSRGAERCVFIDKDADSVKIIKTNLNKLKIPNGSFEVYNVSFDFALKKLSGKKFNVIFADPPYALKLEGKMLELIEKFDVLEEGGVVVIERDTANRIPVLPQYDYDERIMGNTSVSFLMKK